jgi:hypothetical protein
LADHGNGNPDIHLRPVGGEIMPVLFWGLTAAMIVVAIVIITSPFRSARRLPANWAAIVLVLVPVAALGLYAMLGTPGGLMLGQGASPTTKTNPHSSYKTATSVASLVGRLETRLRSEPEDASGWLLLAKSYEHLGQNEKAVAAYDRARSLRKSNYALEKSLTATNLPQPESKVRSGPELRGRVALAPNAASQVVSSDTVFIFAKQNAQDRMPIVALRKSAADLPIDFVLTDEQAMVPGSSLIDFEELIVTARISRSGMAQDIEPGLQATSKPISPLAKGRIDLLISNESLTTESSGVQTNE